MKRWALIALGIFASWLLQQLGWLDAVLWAGLWCLLALLVLACCGFLLDCVVYSLRPANAPPRPGLFGIVRESLQEVRETDAREKHKEADALALENARRAAAAGDLQPLEALAAEGLGDAWLLLAERCADPANPGYDEAAATAAYARAAQSKRWVLERAAHAFSLWENRVFLGIGSVADYAELARGWEQHHFSGYERERELAWLYAHGRGVTANAEKAWYWLALHRARWGEREPVKLPEGDEAGLRAMLEARVNKRTREKMEKQTAGLAHAEFVSTR